jgi:hypothetical protein
LLKVLGELLANIFVEIRVERILLLFTYVSLYLIVNKVLSTIITLISHLFSHANIFLLLVTSLLIVDERYLREGGVTYRLAYFLISSVYSLHIFKVDVIIISTRRHPQCML